MIEPSEQELLELLTNPNSHEQGFRLLVRQYQERLYWHIRRLVGTHEDANDVLQNVFIKVHRNIYQFSGNAKLYTWLYRIASNESLTFIKQQKRHSVADLETSFMNALQADPYFDGDAAQIKLQVALRQLPDKQQLVFVMRYFEALSYEDISKVLETSVGALKASYHHAAKKIEAQLRTMAEE